MKTLVIYPGTFDPVTTGHLDLVRRSCDIFSRLIVAVAESTPKASLFSLEERVEMLRLATREFPRVSVESFSGLLVDYMKSQQAHVILRGLRALSDFEYEFQLAQMNRKLYPGFEIIYMMPDERYTSISSSLVKEVALLGGQVSEFVPESVLPFLNAKLADKTAGG